MTGKLLALLGLKATLSPYHEHDAERARPALLARMRAGGSVALVSDAGTPLLSDPGYRLVRACLDEEIAVTSLPGASALLTALQLSGLPCDRFLFAGFLPNKSTGGAAELAYWRPCRRRWCSMNRRSAWRRRWPTWPRYWARAARRWRAN